MKLFFCSRVSKLSVLKALCALGLTTFSLPVTAVAQEICVRTSAGRVVCGTPIQRPTSTQNQAGNDETTQTTVDNNTVTWDLKSCVRQPKLVMCTITIASIADLKYGIWVDNNTKLVDSEGNEYYASKVQMGQRVAGMGGVIEFPIAKGAHYKTTIDFTGIPTSTSQVSLFQISNNYRTLVKFRNVPIN